MSETETNPSARKAELLEAAYSYALAHGLADLSLRPLSAAIGTSPRVLLFLFGSKEMLMQAILARARAEELAMLEALHRDHPDADLAGAVLRVWEWLANPRHRRLLALWVEGYSRSLISQNGPWANFGLSSVANWLEVLATYQPAGVRSTGAGAAQRTAALAVLRGSLLDLLATGDEQRTGAAIRQQLRGFTRQSSPEREPARRSSTDRGT